MLLFIVFIVLYGLVAGALARLALPGPDPMGLLATTGLGLAGSLVGGVVSYLLLGYTGGIVISIAGAILVLYLHRRFVQHRPLTGPGAKRLPPP